MAIIDATAFKVQTAAMAAALTAAWKDSAKTEVAATIRNPLHPLRQYSKFFTFDAATGIVSADDTYVDACYAGLAPSKGSQLDKITDVVMALVSAAVADLAPTLIVVTFDTTITSVRKLSIAGTVTTEKAISSVSIEGAVVTIEVDSAYISTDTITVSGDFYGNSLNYVTLTDEAVTNNVA